MFKIRMGKPEVENYWADLVSRLREGRASKVEKKTAKKLLKVFRLIGDNPRHPGLNSHDIDDLSRRAGFKVWQSYIENNTPSAGRIFWAYGPGRNEITILSIDHHPNSNKSNAYDKITLSVMESSNKEQ